MEPEGLTSRYPAPAAAPPRREPALAELLFTVDRLFCAGRVTRVGVGEWLGEEAVGGRGRRADADRRSTGESSASSPLPPPSGVRVTSRPQEGTLRRKGL